MINHDDIPSWILKLEVEDLSFIREFVLSSGSLKEVAKQYQVSYPTMRIRLDNLIEKLKIEETIDDSFVRKIKSMVLDDKLDYEAAKEILSAYRKEKK